MEKSVKINKRQKDACENFIKTGNKEEALLKAGYKTNTVWKKNFAEKFFQREYIREYIKGRIKKDCPERVADEGEIMEYLTGILRGGITEEIVIDKRVVNKPPTLRERNKAAELLGRHYGLYSERKRGKKADAIEIKVDVEE